MQGAPDGFGIAGDLVTSAAVSKDGGTIVWGMANGSVHIARTGLSGRFVHGQGQRGAAPVPLGRIPDHHMGSVIGVAFLGATEIIATCGLDGVAKVWDCASGALWSSQVMYSIDGKTEEPSQIAISTCVEGITVACGSESGTVHVWVLESKSLSTIRYSSTAGEGSVRTLLLDAASVLVHHEGDEVFYRLSASSKQAFGHTEGYISEITAIAADFQRLEQIKTSALISIDGRVISEEEPNVPTSLDFGRMAFIVAGDDQGRTFIWNWDAEGDGLIKPIRCLQGFEAKVTSIEITEPVILLGS